MNKRTLTIMLLATLGVAACGSDAAPSSQAAAGPAPLATAAPAVQPAPTTTVAAAPAAGASIAVKAATSPFGQILVDPAGNTLYAFTNDTDAQSTCTGTCAEAWPPVIVDPSWSVAPGLDAGVFSTIIRDDGSEQLTAGRYPLYLFSGDARPGDANGQGSGGVWFVVDTKAAPVQDAAGSAPESAPDSAPDSDSGSGSDSGYGTGDATVESAPETTVAEEAAAPLVTTAENPLGSILVGENGNTLYGFTPDADVTPTCVDGCAAAWPPVIVDASFDVASLPNAELFSIVDRADGTKQLKAGKWPLYFFAGDAAPGETNGQGSGGKWFVVAADAKLIK